MTLGSVESELANLGSHRQSRQLRSGLLRVAARLEVNRAGVTSATEAWELRPQSREAGDVPVADRLVESCERYAWGRDLVF